jgi:hypothetical protein
VADRFLLQVLETHQVLTLAKEISAVLVEIILMAVGHKTVAVVAVELENVATLELGRVLTQGAVVEVKIFLIYLALLMGNLVGLQVAAEDTLVNSAPYQLVVKAAVAVVDVTQAVTE